MTEYSGDRKKVADFGKTGLKAKSMNLSAVMLVKI